MNATLTELLGKADAIALGRIPAEAGVAAGQASVAELEARLAEARATLAEAQIALASLERGFDELASDLAGHGVARDKLEAMVQGRVAQLIALGLVPQPAAPASQAASVPAPAAVAPEPPAARPEPAPQAAPVAVQSAPTPPAPKAPAAEPAPEAHESNGPVPGATEGHANEASGKGEPVIAGPGPAIAPIPGRGAPAMPPVTVDQEAEPVATVEAPAAPSAADVEAEPAVQTPVPAQAELPVAQPQPEPVSAGPVDADPLHHGEEAEHVEGAGSASEPDVEADEVSDHGEILEAEAEAVAEGLDSDISGAASGEQGRDAEEGEAAPSALSLFEEPEPQRATPKPASRAKRQKPASTPPATRLDEAFKSVVSELDAEEGAEGVDGQDHVEFGAEDGEAGVPETEVPPAAPEPDPAPEPEARPAPRPVPAPALRPVPRPAPAAAAAPAPAVTAPAAPAQVPAPAAQPPAPPAKAPEPAPPGGDFVPDFLR